MLRKKRYFVIAIFILLLTGSMYYFPALAADANKVIITGDVVNVRQLPGTSYSVITQVRKGETYTIKTQENGWFEIKLPSGESGWIADWLAQKVITETDIKQKAVVTVDDLNVRSDASLSSSIIGKLHTGDLVHVLEETQDWSRISFNEGDAWVSSDYLKSEQAKAKSTSVDTSQTQISILYDGTNIRKKPSIQSKIVQTVSAGEVFTVTNKEGDWLEIDYGSGKTGYVANWIVSQPNQHRSGTKGLAGKTIVLDPGHGGRDQGTEGASGTLEKEVTLKTAKLLAKKLQNKGVNVILTRSGDKYVDLSKRTNIASQYNADAFISLHYDSIHDRTINGHTTYYYYFYEKELAEKLHNRISNSIDMKDRGVRYGNYYVTRENQRPAVLLELGYLSNPNEEGQIRRSNFQENITEAIVSGLDDYFSN